MMFKKNILVSFWLLVPFLFLNNIYSSTPPTLTAAGNQYYCPQSQQNIVTDFNITNPDNAEIKSIYIQISSGYQRGEDILKLNGTVANIAVSSFDSLEGKIVLTWVGSGTANLSSLITAVKNIVFQSNSATPTGTKTFSITIGEANYLPTTKHYYEYVPSLGITWQNAKTAAESRNYYGLKGYLATVTTIEEAKLTGEQASGAGWIGGSDVAVEGTWRWMTGPETGKSFWIGGGNGTTAGTDIPFAFWNSSNNEPNNLGNEDYAHVTAPGIGTPGSWNDLSNIGGSSGDYQPKGYIVEYGGTLGDPVLNISASTKISIAEITSSSGDIGCGTTKVSLTASSSSGKILWFSSLTGGTPIASGYVFSPTISTTTTYYALASSDGVCEKGTRVPVVATIYQIPTITNTTTQSICQVGSAFLSAAASSGIVNWYSNLTGGSILHLGNSFTTPIINSTTTYYVDATENGCTTAQRTPVTVTVFKTDKPTTSLPEQTFCSSENATLNNLSINGTDILWYATANSTIPLNKIQSILNNTSYFATQTINSCESTERLEIKVKIFETPTPQINIPKLSLCDSNITGTDVDGEETFDLTLNNTFILNGKNTTDFNIRFYKDAALIQPINNPTNFKNTKIGSPQTIYFFIENKNSPSCNATGSFKIEVSPLPVLKSSQVILEQCDDDENNDGFSSFNLNQANELISANYKNEQFEFYKDAGFTQLITNPLAYENPTVINSTVYVKIKTVFGCERFASIKLKVGATQIPSTFHLNYYTCEDLPSTNQDGKTIFNFSDATQQLIDTKSIFSSQLVRISYYESLENALSEINAIPDISNYKNSTPWEQKIYIRIDSDDVNACLGLNHVITLHVEPLPVANPVTIDRQCDDNDDGFFPFDTSKVDETVRNGQSNITVNYFDENNNLLPSPLPNPFLTKSQTITIKVENSTSSVNPSCSDETTLEFIVDVSPKIYPVTIPALCDDGLDTTDGFSSFDTSNIEAQLLGAQNGMKVTYTNENNTILPSPLPNPFFSNSQKITATVTNKLNEFCSISADLNFVVNPLPSFEVEPEQIVCLNLLPKTLEIYNSKDNYTYEWFDEQGNTIGNSNEVLINKGGTYTVLATSNLGCVSLPRSIHVEESIIAEIDLNDIVIVDDSNNNTITINTSNNNLGIGNYEFSLDDIFGFYQDEPYFDNVEAGIHTIYIRDKNNCGIAAIDVSVLGFPKFFTPNNDGYNDTWEVKGANVLFYPTSSIQIFDRFGKLITQLNVSSNGWDGSYKGEMLSSTDYWYSVQLIDTSGNIREKRGHFSLIRK
ncbi:T9SS type B sorting domain-containing protein [Lutibacter sp.]|uniref:Ig-like domain-containing protein n=1 Tax=Lutibacter sp. TaxID=1925666 RepID=UPI001A2AED6C|nr:T9SS type B sorting domain-containing protein [Lutibacter sp.]MBI9040963.1 T9SS type B sorting domain-containing protein [Lutibacter sp.]